MERKVNYNGEKNQNNIDKDNFNKENNDLNIKKNIINFSSRRKSHLLLQNINNFENSIEKSEKFDKELKILNKAEFIFFEELNEIFSVFQREINKKKNLEINKIKNKILLVRNSSINEENTDTIKKIKNILENFDFQKLENDLKSKIKKIKIEIDLKKKNEIIKEKEKSKFNKVNRSLLSNFEYTSSKKKFSRSKSKKKILKSKSKNSEVFSIYSEISQNIDADKFDISKIVSSDFGDTTNSNIKDLSNIKSGYKKFFNSSNTTNSIIKTSNLKNSNSFNKNISDKKKINLKEKKSNLKKEKKYLEEKNINFNISRESSGIIDKSKNTDSFSISNNNYLSENNNSTSNENFSIRSNSIKNSKDSFNVDFEKISIKKTKKEIILKKKNERIYDIDLEDFDDSNLLLKNSENNQFEKIIKDNIYPNLDNDSQNFVIESDFSLKNDKKSEIVKVDRDNIFNSNQTAKFKDYDNSNILIDNSISINSKIKKKNNRSKSINIFKNENLEKENSVKSVNLEKENSIKSVNLEKNPKKKNKSFLKQPLDSNQKEYLKKIYKNKKIILNKELLKILNEINKEKKKQIELKYFKIDDRMLNLILNKSDLLNFCLSLNLQNNMITDKGIKIFLEFLSKNKDSTLYSLFINGNKLTSLSLKYFFEFFEKNNENHLKNIDISENFNLEPEFDEKIIKIYKEKQIKIIFN